MAAKSISIVISFELNVLLKQYGHIEIVLQTVNHNSDVKPLFKPKDMNLKYFQLVFISALISFLFLLISCEGDEVVCPTVSAECVSSCWAVEAPSNVSGTFIVQGGTAIQFRVTFSGDIGGCQFTYSSSNSNVADVEGNGNSFTIYSHVQGSFEVVINITDCSNSSNCINDTQHRIPFTVN